MLNEYSFGSRLDEFTVDRIAAVHDGCGLSLPHSYDGLDDRDAGPAETEKERQQRLAGLLKGVDGFQTNRPDAAADALEQQVASRLVPGPGDRIGLVGGLHGLPLANRTVDVDGTAVVTGRGGCVPAAGARRVTFAGGGSALAADALPVPVVPELPWVPLLPLVGVATAGALALRRRPVAASR